VVRDAVGVGRALGRDAGCHGLLETNFSFRTVGRSNFRQSDTRSLDPHHQMQPKFDVAKLVQRSARVFGQRPPVRCTRGVTTSSASSRRRRATLGGTS